MKPILEYLFSKKSDLDKINKSNRFGITKKDLIGDLKYFPLGVVIRMLEEQEMQGYKPDVTVFQRHNDAGEDLRGFIWYDTETGITFWKQVIRESNFDLFFKKYPEYEKYNL